MLNQASAIHPFVWTLYVNNKYSTKGKLIQRVWMSLPFPMSITCTAGKGSVTLSWGFYDQTGVGSPNSFLLGICPPSRWGQGNGPPQGGLYGDNAAFGWDVCSASAAHPTPWTWLPAPRETLHLILGLFFHSLFG